MTKDEENQLREWLKTENQELKNDLKMTSKEALDTLRKNLINDKELNECCDILEEEIERLKKHLTKERKTAKRFKRKYIELKNECEIT